MSGPRQHYLPRFLMKGFASRIKKKIKYYTWVYARDREPYETNSINIGLETYFYGKTTEPLVDDAITKEEITYSEILDKLRNYETTCPLDNHFPEEFITHLVIRSRHLRRSFQEAGDLIIDIASKHLANPDNVYKLLSNIVINKPELIEQELREKLKETLHPEDTKDEIVKYAISHISKLLPNILRGAIYRLHIYCLPWVD